MHIIGAAISRLPRGTQLFCGITPARALARVREVLAGLQIPDVTSYGTHDFRRGHAKDLQESGSYAWPHAGQSIASPLQHVKRRRTTLRNIGRRSMEIASVYGVPRRPQACPYHDGYVTSVAFPAIMQYRLETDLVVEAHLAEFDVEECVCPGQTRLPWARSRASK